MGLIGLEIPVFGTDSAGEAVRAGASRLEVNTADSYLVGGLTPSIDEMAYAASLNVPMRIMIQPRGPPSAAPGGAVPGRDFVYSEEEVQQMEDDIVRFKSTGLLQAARGDGFVFGILMELPPRDPTAAGQPPTPTPQENLLSDFAYDTRPPAGPRPRCEVDIENCMRLVEAARPFGAVFHRAFDEIVSCEGGLGDGRRRFSWQNSMQDLVCLGFDGILTSGGLGSAAQNADTLERILDEAAGSGIEIIVGGGVRSKYLSGLLWKLRMHQRNQPLYVHSSCIPPGETEFLDHLEARGILNQLE